MKKRMVMTTVASLFATVGAGALGATEVAASSDGCTAAPGGLGSYHCVLVSGSGTHVRLTQSSYGAANNLCRTQTRWQFTQGGIRSAHYSNYRAGCVWLRAYFTWEPNAHYDNGSSFCSSMRADVSGDAYPSAACVKIKR